MDALRVCLCAERAGQPEAVPAGADRQAVHCEAEVGDGVQGCVPLPSVAEMSCWQTAWLTQRPPINGVQDISRLLTGT